MSEKAMAAVSTVGNYKVRMTARDHELVVDEPEENGGDDAGSTPREMFLGSLGSCIAITLLMYARRKKWQLDNVDISMSHERVQAEQGADAVERISLDIKLDGQLDEEQRERLASIATRCPVSRIVTGNAVIDANVTIHSR